MTNNHSNTEEQYSPVEHILNKCKGKVLFEFEKVCPGDRAFRAFKKTVHDIFDEASEELSKLIK